MSDVEKYVCVSPSVELVLDLVSLREKLAEIHQRVVRFADEFNLDASDIEVFIASFLKPF